MLTATQGEAIMAHRFKDYQPYKGEIERRNNGSLAGRSYSHSMVPVGFGVRSYSTRLTPGTSVTMRLVM